ATARIDMESNNGTDAHSATAPDDTDCAHAADYGSPAQTLFADALRLVFSFLPPRHLLLSTLLACRHWLAAASAPSFRPSLRLSCLCPPLDPPSLLTEA